MSKSSFTALVGAEGKKSHQAHIKDPLPSGDLPENVKGGVAQLKTVSVAQHEDGDNKGKPYVRFGFVATFPEQTESGERVAGRQFSEQFPMYGRSGKTFGLNYTSVPDTFDNRYAAFLNRLKESFGITEAITFEQVDDVLAALRGKKPFIRFHTSKKTDQDRVFPRIGRAYVPDNENGQADANADVDDQTGNADTGDAGDTGNTDASTNGAAANVTDLDTMDLDQLLELAVTDEGEAARNKILDIADEHGIKDEVEGAKEWSIGVDMLKAKISESTTSEEPTEPEDTAPATQPTAQPFAYRKGNTCRYQQLDGNGKPLMNKGKKIPPIEVEIMSSSDKGKWVTIKVITTGKAIVGADKLPAHIPWSALITG
jgi:hypothetical protein